MLCGPVVSCSVVTYDTVFLYYTRGRISLIISQMLLLIFLLRKKKEKTKKLDIPHQCQGASSVHVGAWQQNVELVLEAS